MDLKPQSVINKRHNLIIGIIVFAITITIYFLTMARSLSFWDAGEYITCSSILGVPHPPGNPFYILLGRFFTIFGANIPHAFVINFLSALFSAFAVMFTYFFTVKFITMWIKPKDAYLAYLGGFLAAFYTAFSFTFWNNAIEAEVYSGLAFIINLIVWLTMIWVEKSEDLSHQNLLLLIIYIFFLGFGIHQTSLQIAPAVLFIAVYPMLRSSIRTSTFWKRVGAYTLGLIAIYIIFLNIGKSIHIPDLPKFMFATGFLGILVYHLREKVSKKTWLFALLFIGVAVSTHLFLYIRASHRPFINEGYPHTFKLFTDYILRRQYGVTSMFVRRATFFFQMKDQFLTYFSWQFFNNEILSQWLRMPGAIIQLVSNLIVTFLGFGGAYYHFKKNKHSFAYFFSFMFMASIAMVFVINLSDAEVRERDYFFSTAYNFWTVWMAIGSLALVDLVRKKGKILTGLFIVIVLALPGINLASQYFIHNRSREYIALDYGQNILNSVEENAIIFTNGDNDTFPVWYAQAVEDPAAVEFVHLATGFNARPIEAIEAEFKVAEANWLSVEEEFNIAKKDFSIAKDSLKLKKKKLISYIRIDTLNYIYQDISDSLQMLQSSQNKTNPMQINDYHKKLENIQKEIVLYQQRLEDDIGKIKGELNFAAKENQYNELNEIRLDYKFKENNLKSKKSIVIAMDYKNKQCSGIRKDVTIANLSLLNTPWYIKQLRDHEGVEFNIPESHIDLCQDDPRSALYPRRIPKDTHLKIKGTVPEDEFIVTFKKDEILYVKDLAVIQIIKDNYGKRPIYFAVTTPDPIGFNDYLRNEGMVSRLVPVKGKDQFDMERLITNIDSVYSYRGIMDDSIYKDTNMRRLLNNYGAAFMRTSRFAHTKNDYENAIKYMEKAIDFIDQKSRFYVGLSQLYAEASFNYFDSNENEKGFSYLEKAVYYNRTDKNMIQLIYQSAIYTNDIESGIKLFEKIREYQDSVEIDFYITQLKELQ